MLPSAYRTRMPGLGDAVVSAQVLGACRRVN